MRATSRRVDGVEAAYIEYAAAALFILPHRAGGGIYDMRTRRLLLVGFVVFGLGLAAETSWCYGVAGWCVVASWSGRVRLPARVLRVIVFVSLVSPAVACSQGSGGAGGTGRPSGMGAAAAGALAAAALATPSGPGVSDTATPGDADGSDSSEPGAAGGTIGDIAGSPEAGQGEVGAHEPEVVKRTSMEVEEATERNSMDESLAERPAGAQGIDRSTGALARAADPVQRAAAAAAAAQAEVVLPADGSLSPYECERMGRIARNDTFMRHLGLGGGLAGAERQRRASQPRAPRATAARGDSGSGGPRSHDGAALRRRPRRDTEAPDSYEEVSVRAKMRRTDDGDVVVGSGEKLRRLPQPPDPPGTKISGGGLKRAASRSPSPGDPDRTPPLRRTQSVGSRGGGSSPASSQPLRRADTARASKRPREAVVGFSCGTSGDATSGMSARALRRVPDVGNVRKGFSVGLVW